MHYILSIETSTKTCSTALHESGKLLGEIILTTEKAHSEMLTLSIDALFEQCKISPDSLHAVAVSSGPGSYTGLRIGSSVAKGLCFAKDIPLIAVPTLAAMTHGFAERIWRGDYFFVPMIDARRMEVYTQIFDGELSPLNETESKIIDENSFSEILHQKKVVFFGDGAAKCQNVILSENALFAPGFLFTAACLGTLAHDFFLQKKFADTAYFEPFYLKEYQAVKSKNPLSRLGK